MLSGGAQSVSWHPLIKTAAAGTWPWAHKRQTGDGNAANNRYRKHIYPPKVNDRPRLYTAFKNTWNELIVKGFWEVLMCHFSLVAVISGPVSPSTVWHSIHFRGGATEQKRKNKGFKVCRLKNAKTRLLMLGLALQWEFEGAISDSCLVNWSWIFSLQAVELLPLLLWEKQKALFSTWTVAWAAAEVFMGLWTELEKG